MNVVTKVVYQQQGPYLWRVRDCLVTAKMILQARNQPYPTYEEWHKLEEHVAIVTAKKRFGNLFEAHKYEFEQCGLTVEDKPISPGDILILGGIVSSFYNIWDTRKKCELLGFVSPDFTVLSWTMHGLESVSITEVKGVV